MNIIDFTKEGGMPLGQSLLAFMQSYYLNVFKELTRIYGDYVILSGDQKIGGWVIVKGEVMPFEAGEGDLCYVYTTKEPLVFGNGKKQEVLITKKLLFGSCCDPLKWSDFKTVSLETTNELFSSLNSMTSVVNGVSSTDQIITINHLDSSVNTLTSIINGLTREATIINSNVLTFSTDNILRSQINGVQDSVKIDVDEIITKGNLRAGTLIDVEGGDQAVLKNTKISISPYPLGEGFIIGTREGKADWIAFNDFVAGQLILLEDKNTINLIGNGQNSDVKIINGLQLSSENNDLNISVNGITTLGVNLINKNELTISGNTLISNVNGIKSKVTLPNSSNINIIPYKQLTIYKHDSNTADTLEQNDVVYGFINSTTFLYHSQYKGGDPEDVNSYESSVLTTT